jgi:tetratricopeptide (TPR) repeat protein
MAQNPRPSEAGLGRPFDRGCDLQQRYERTLALHRGDQLDEAAAHANLGNAECALGFFDKALTSYQRALTLQPGHRWALGDRPC